MSQSELRRRPALLDKRLRSTKPAQALREAAGHVGKEGIPQ